MSLFPDIDAALARRALSAQRVAELARVLADWPWRWPQDRPGLTAAATHLRRGPPTLAIGVAPLVTVRGNATELWAFDIVSNASATPDHVSFDPAVKSLWNDATAAVSASLPAQWELLPTPPTPPPARFLGLSSPDSGPLSRSHLLTDSSFGLSFALALASRAIGVPLLINVAASATIAGTGALGPVQGIQQKVRDLAVLAPGIDEILVHADDVDDARAAGSRLRVTGLKTIAEAIHHVWQDRVFETLAFADAVARKRIARSLFRLTLGDRAAQGTWHAVREAATHALRWSGIDDDMRNHLLLAHAIAQRHENNAAAPMPSEAWVNSLPEPIHLRVLSQLIQQHTDTGVPDRAFCERIVARHLPLTDSARDEEVKIAGAWARVLSSSGDVEGACELQRAAAHRWAERLASAGEGSYPVSEWLRLSGALGRIEALEEAVAFVDENWPEMWASYFARHERAKARVALQAVHKNVDCRFSFAAAVSDLDVIANDHGFANHVRHSAARALARAKGLPGAPATAAIPRGANEGDLAFRAVLDAVAALEDAVQQPGKTGTQARVAALTTLLATNDPIATRLNAAAIARKEDAACFVARYYPY